MSIESAKAFFEKIKNDEDFNKSLGEIATSEERMEYVKKAGFDFTKEEIKSIKDELSDEDLDKVAGGGDCTSNDCNCLPVWKFLGLN
jgi:predicted ribosomally synthesized peptide with nif11-like leader